MGVLFLAKRETVRVDVAAVVAAIKNNGWSASTLCKKMGRSVTWVSEWKKTPPKNFPSPEEAARMCAILGVDPADILLEQADINKVTALLDAERPKKNQPDEDDGLPQEFMIRYNGLSEENQKKVDEYIDLLLNAQSNQ